MLLIDARYLAQPPSGIPRYTANLLRAIRATDPTRPVRILLQHPDHLPPDLATHPAFDPVVDPHAPRSPRDQLRWPKRLKRLNPSAVHCPDAFAPLLLGSSRPAVLLTLHDVIPLLSHLHQHPPHQAQPLKQRVPHLWKAWLQQQTQHAQAVLTVSQHAAHDIQQHLHVPPQKIHVVPNAVPPPTPTSTPTSTPSRGELPQGIQPPYLLCVGRSDPYKNLVTLIDAFHHIADQHPTLQLLCVGPEDPRFPQARQRAQQLNRSPRVHFLHDIDDPQLQTLYAHAHALVMPSRYEGFGLPAIEAMHHHTPVLAANAGALPETVAHAAITFDPDQPQQLAQRLHQLLTDPHLRQTLIQAGRQRTQAFTLQAMGSAYLQALDQTLHHHQ